MDLVSLARRRDPWAMREIMQRHNRPLFRLVRSVLGNDAEAEDALQDAYLQAFTRLDGFEGRSSLATWLGRIALNAALMQLRRRRAMNRHDAEAEALLTAEIIAFPFVPPGAGDPEHLAARGEVRRLLEEAIDTLPASFRVVFVLHSVEQMPLAEIAACVGVPENTVKTRLHRARRLLRVRLGEQIGLALADSFPFAGARCAHITARVLQRLGLSDRQPSG